jgi:hypothetical protein
MLIAVIDRSEILHSLYSNQVLQSAWGVTTSYKHGVGLFGLIHPNLFLSNHPEPAKVLPAPSKRLGVQRDKPIPVALKVVIGAGEFEVIIAGDRYSPDGFVFLVHLTILHPSARRSFFSSFECLTNAGHPQ